MRRIARGLRWSPKYGHHPGLTVFAFMVLLCSAAFGWRGLGAAVVIFGIPLLIGAWARGEM